MDISKIHNDRTCHDRCHFLQIEGAKLLPLRHDNERMGAFRTIIRIVAEGDIFKNLLCLRHTHRKFDIDASRLWAEDLAEPMLSQPWFDLDDFNEGLEAARKRWRE